MFYNLSIAFFHTGGNLMNSFVEQHFEIFKMTQAMRDQLMGVLSDEDLAFSPGGENPTLGELCRESGEIDVTYTQSFKTFKMNFDYRNEEAGAASSVERLRTWLRKVQGNLNETLEGLSEADLGKMIDRGGGFVIPAAVQPHIYREALLIFYGKAAVYLKAMGKPLPQQWQEWIG